MNSSKSADPFDTLGLPKHAGENEVRARYLELVKKYSPERDPERFREIRAAYEAAKNPQLIAKRLLVPPTDEPPTWATTLETQKQRPPKLSLGFLLSLGNRGELDSSNPSRSH